MTLFGQSCLTLCDLMTVAHQAFLSMEFSRQECGVGCYFLLQEIFLTQGWHSHLFASPALQVDSLPTKPAGKLQNAAAAAYTATCKIDNQKGFTETGTVLSIL